MISPGVAIFPNLDHLVQEQLGLRPASRRGSLHCREEPLEFTQNHSAIKDSVHLHPCSFQDMNSMAVAAGGRSAVNYSTFAHSSRAGASSLSHNMHKWPVSSSGPPQKMKGSAGITVRVIFCLHRRMTCMVGRRPSLARSRSRCVGP